MKTARKSVALSLGAAAVTLGAAGLVSNNTYAYDHTVSISDEGLYTCLTTEGNVKKNPSGEVISLPIVDAQSRTISVDNIENAHSWVDINCVNDNKGYGINSIDSLASFPTNIAGLRLSYNNISSVQALSSQPRIHYLHLDHNNLSEIYELGAITELEVVNISNNNINSLAAFNYKEHLNTIIANNNKISDLNSLVYVPYLTSLEVADNNIMSLQGIRGRTDLVTLEASSNKLGDDTKDILSTLTGLETLRLYNTGISTLSFTANMPNLKTLNVSANNISDYSSLANNTNLESLALTGNKSHNISSLAGLNNLKYLWLANLGINDNDLQNLKNLTSLETLILTGNQLTKINALSNLTNLTELNVALNNISDFSGPAPELTYKAAHASRYYGQYLTMDAGTASSVELPASFSQALSGLKEFNWIYRIEVWGGEYNEDTNIVTFKDDAESIRVRLTADLIYQNDPANPYYVEVEITRTIEDKGEDEKGQEKEGDKKEQKNPNTKNGISAAAGIFGGMIAAMGALFTIKRTRR